MKNRKSILAIAMCAIMLLGGVIGVSAYFTDTDESINEFTVGKVTIDHIEDEWDDLPDEEKEDITPNKEFAKDPSIVNTGNNAAFVFQTVEVPCANVITANADGTRNGAALVDLFAPRNAANVGDGWTIQDNWQTGSVNAGWTLMKTEDVKEGNVVVAHKYTYVYGTAEKCTELAAGAETPSLIDAVRFANIVEGQGLEETAQEIVIGGYGIQVSDLGDNATTAPSEVLAILYNQNGLQ